MRLCDYGPTVVGLQELLYYNDHTSIDLLMHVHGLIKNFWAADDGGGDIHPCPPPLATRLSTSTQYCRRSALYKLLCMYVCM